MNLEIELDSIKIEDSYIKNGKKCVCQEKSEPFAKKKVSHPVTEKN